MASPCPQAVREIVLAELCASEKGLTKNADTASTGVKPGSYFVVHKGSTTQRQPAACISSSHCHAHQKIKIIIMKKKNHSGTHLIIEYAGMLARHIVTVTIACKAHIHISSCHGGGQNRLSSYWKKKNCQAAENNRQN